MLEILLVGIGGGLGAVARYSIGKKVKEKNRFNLPVSTMIINISGSFLLGICIVKLYNPSAKLLLQTGFIGGFTTFSTFMVEGYSLYKTSDVKLCFKFFVMTIVLGVAAFTSAVFIFR